MQLRKFKRSRFWYVVGRDSAGKRYAVSTKQTARDAAARAARAIELARAVPRLPRYSLSEALVALAQHKHRKRVSEAELQILATKGGRLLEHFGPSRDVHTIGPVDVDGYTDARRKHVGDQTIRMELQRLIEALRVAKRAGLYEGDPSRLRPTSLAPYVPRDRWLTPAEFLALLSELEPHRAEYVLIWAHTGVRYSELHRLTAASLDREQRRLWVKGHKGSREHRERWVPLSDAAFAILERRADEAATGAPLFTPWLKPNVRLTLARACRRAGMAPCTPNDLRRTYVTWQLGAGTSEVEVQQSVGHSPRSTLVRSVYGHRTAGAGRRAVAGFPVPAAAPAVSQAVSQTGRRLRGLRTTPRTPKASKTG